MVNINEQKCTGCGVCVSICHESCLSLANNIVHIDQALCSTCTQCIAICPQAALRWNETPPVPFDKSLFPSADQLDELFKQRRTIRYFTKKKPEQHLIEEIVQYGAYAPTHNFNFRVVVVDNEEILEQIDRVVFAYNQKIYRYLYKPKIVHALIKTFFPSQEHEYLKARPKLEKSVRWGRGYQSMPPVLVLIVGDKRIPLSLESAQYALYTMDLYARTKELGCRNLVGNQMFLNRSKALKHRLQIADHEKIFATMGLGYPAKTFRNKVMEKTLPIGWNPGGPAPTT